MRSSGDNTLDLFVEPHDTPPGKYPLAPGALFLRGFALPDEQNLLAALKTVIAEAPLRHMITRGGYKMSVAMTNCGDVGWVSDRTGYRYDPRDPDTGRRWPKIPASFLRLATSAAVEAGYKSFTPDACLVNQYEAGTKLSMHQDKDEKDFQQPIVSVSLGIPATFLFGGESRGDPTQRLRLHHGDVVVWGGPARLRYHGVAPLNEADHPLLGKRRINLTFRKAG
jgi:alkylated DNA repair protein (DNA oxidative demethylase)